MSKRCCGCGAEVGPKFVECPKCGCGLFESDWTCTTSEGPVSDGAPFSALSRVIDDPDTRGPRPVEDGSKGVSAIPLPPWTAPPPDADVSRSLDRKLFVGYYTRALGASRRVLLPRSFLDAMLPVSLPRYVIVAPSEDAVDLIPLEVVRRFPRLGWIHNMQWTPEVCKVLANNKVYANRPLFERGPGSDALDRAVQLLKSECAANAEVVRRLSGSDFEKLVAEVFRAAGWTVQLNVRVTGGEIDIVVLESSGRGTVQFAIVECKRWSGRLVGVRDVVRLYGLAEALRKQGVEVERKIVVTTAGFSSDARQFAAIHDVTLVDFEALREIAAMDPSRREAESLPFFRTAALGRNGTFRIPDPLVMYLKVGEESAIVLSGMGDFAEMWSVQGFEQWERTILADYEMPLARRRAIPGL